MKIFLYKIKNYFTNLFWIAIIEVSLKYSRSLIGPFWVTLNSSIIIAGLSFVNTSIFSQPASTIVPWIGFGILAWNYIIQIIEDAYSIFTNKIFLNVNFQVLDIVIVNIIKNIIFFLHNLIIFIIIIFYFELEPLSQFHYLILGIVFYLIYSICILILIGLLCTRYRDFILIIKNLTFLTFLVTPIFWLPDAIGANRAVLLDYNFVFHIIQIIRDPLLGVEPSNLTLMTNFIITILIVPLTFVVYKKNKKKFVFWI